MALGFKVDGDDKIDRVDRQLGKAQISAAGLLAGVAALNAAFYAFINRGVEAAVTMDMWRIATGKQVEELNKLQYGAARANVAAATISDAVKVIQRTRAEISLGNVDASSPWFMLGIDPREDPSKVLNNLRSAIRGMDPALARNFIQKMGFGDDLLYLLQQKQTLGSLFVRPEDIDRLTRLGGAWKALLFNVSIVATRFAAVFAEDLSRSADWLERVAIRLDRVVTWLNSGSTAAAVMRRALMALVVVMGLLLVALSGFVALLTVLKGLFIAIQLIPIVAALTAFLAVIALIVGSLAALVLLIQDFWTAVEGGQSLFDWNKGLVITIQNVERLARLMEKIRDAATSFPDWVKNTFTTQRGYGFGMMGEFLFGNPEGFGKRMATGGMRMPDVFTRPGDHTNNIEINIDGAQDPVQTGREVARSINREISDAMATAPIPTN